MVYTMGGGSEYADSADADDILINTSCSSTKSNLVIPSPSKGKGEALVAIQTPPIERSFLSRQSICLTSLSQDVVQPANILSTHSLYSILVYFIFLSSVPITWLSKKQVTIETSVFGAEFVAMKQGMEARRSLGYTLVYA